MNFWGICLWVDFLFQQSAAVHEAADVLDGPRFITKGWIIASMPLVNIRLLVRWKSRTKIVVYVVWPESLNTVSWRSIVPIFYDFRTILWRFFLPADFHFQQGFTAYKAAEVLDRPRSITKEKSLDCEVWPGTLNIVLTFFGSGFHFQQRVTAHKAAEVLDRYRPLTKGWMFVMLPRDS